MCSSDLGYSHPNWNEMRRSQRTFVATAESLDGEWKIQPDPILEPSGPIETLVVNPAITRGADGRYYLIVKGDKPGSAKFERNQAIAISDRPDGGFVLQPNAVIKDWDSEDMSMWCDEETKRLYAIFHAHTFIGLMTSEDGVNWEKAKDFKVMGKEIVRGDGLPNVLPTGIERPFVFVEDGKPRVLSVAVKWFGGAADDACIMFIPLKK